MSKKVVVLQRAHKNPRPTLAPLMDRPMTPHLDTRNGLNSSRNSIAHISSPASFKSTDPKQSQLYKIAEEFEKTTNAEQIPLIIQDFTSISKNIAETTGVAPHDVNAFYKMYPRLEKFIETSNTLKNTKVLIVLLEGLRYLCSNLLADVPPDQINTSNSQMSISTSGKAKIKSPIITQPTIGKSKVPPLKPVSPQNVVHPPAPMPPTDISSIQSAVPQPPQEPPTKKSQKSDTPSEQISNMMARALLGISCDKSNDSFFLQSDIAPFILGLTSPDHKLETRVLAAKSLFNASNDKDFRKILVNQPNFSLLYKMLDIKGKHQATVYTKVSGIFKNLVLEEENIQKFGKNELPKLLVSALIRAPNPQLAYNVFSLLKNFTYLQEIRDQILNAFSPKELVALFLKNLKEQQEPRFLDRLTCVFADFAANDDSILFACSEVSEEIDITILSDLLANEKILSNPESTARILQVIADLSVLKENADILKLSDTMLPLFAKCNYTESDKVGLYLLCASANFTFHDKDWCPHELVQALPVAIVSKNLPSITEALRILCNLALSPHTEIINSKLPELLVILLSHPSPDIVCYALQTLTNLVPQAGIRRRFTESNGVKAVTELLDCEEIDEAILEAICKLMMNYGSLTPEEASILLEKIDEFDASIVDVVPLFKEYLRKLTLVSV